MAKISELPSLDAPTGEEAVVVVSDGATKRATMSGLVAGAVAPVANAVEDLRHDAIQFIGRPGSATLVNGTALSAGAVYFRDVVANGGTLYAIDVFDKAAGTIRVAVYRGEPSDLTRIALTSVAATGTGTMRTLVLQSPIGVLPTDICAIQTPNAGTLAVAEVQSGNTGYTYSFPDLPATIALDAPTTNGQVQARFRIAYRQQVVTAQSFTALSAVEIADFRATALSGAANPTVNLTWAIQGVMPDMQVIAWEGTSVAIGGGVRSFIPKNQRAVKDFFVSGNSIDDATDTPKWHTILAARRNVTSRFTARYSSDGRQTFRAGIDPLTFTIAGNALPAGGAVGSAASKAITAINGNSPINAGTDYAFLNTGDAGLTTGLQMTGVIVDGAVSRHGTVSIPNAASNAYRFTQDAGLPAIMLSGPVRFIPDIAKYMATSDNFCGVGQNLFYSGVPGVDGNHVNVFGYAIVDKFAAAADGNRFMLRDVLPAASWQPDGTPNVIDGTTYTWQCFSAMEAWNARNEAVHPGCRPRSLPTPGFPNGRLLLKYLQDHGDGSAGSNADIAAGLVPRNLREDDLHPNLAGQTVMADFYEEAMQAQALAPAVTLATVFTITASGLIPTTDTVTTAVATAGIGRDANTDLADAVARLSYRGIDVTSLTVTPSVAEIGATVPSVELAWTIVGASPTVQTATWTGGGSTALVASDRAKTVAVGRTADTTFTLTATDGAAPAGAANTDTATATLRFRHKGHAGIVDKAAAMTSAEANGMAMSWWAEGGARTLSVTATSAGYLWYSQPATQADPSAFKVNGFAVTAVKTLRDHTTATGQVVQYADFRLSNRLSVGAVMNMEVFA